MTDVARDPDPGGTQRSTFERRALAILLIDLVVVVVVVLVWTPLANTGQMATIRVILGLVVGTTSLVSVLVALYGLFAGKPWASTGAALLLLIGNVGGGVLQVVTDLSAGKLTIPLLGIAAAWVLLAAAGRERWAMSRGAVLVGVLAGASLVLGPVSGWLIDAGVIAAGPAALELWVTVECKSGASGDGPFALVKTHWHWRSSEPFPGPSDQNTLSWTTTKGTVSMIDEATGSANVVPGAGAGWLTPSSVGDRASWQYLIDTSGGLADGIATMSLVSADGQGFDLRVRAAYAHAGLWTATGDGSCSVDAARG